MVPLALLPAKEVKVMLAGQAHAITQLHWDRPLAAIMRDKTEEEGAQAVTIMCVDPSSSLSFPLADSSLGGACW